MKKKQLSVRLHGKQIGVLEQLLSGKNIFTYDHDTTESISFSLPIKEDSYTHSSCEAYFGGLLPESDAAKKAIAGRYGISFNNTFALLKAIGYDCAGAISFHDMHDPLVEQKRFELDVKPVSPEALYAHIKALPQDPLFIGFENIRLSLAGAQDKAAVCLVDGKVALPQRGCPTTHILKPSSIAFPNLADNEFICLHIAKELGLNVPDIAIQHIQDISYLLIKRYDRNLIDHKIERIHQEDFCQAYGIISAKKYQNEGGPSLKQCFELLENTSQPVIDRNALASAVVFNFLMGNRDAHGKNFSLLRKDDTQLFLAPLYDLVCTRFYPNLSKKMSMKIGGEYEADRVREKHWEKLCDDIQYSYPVLKKLLKKQGENILSILHENNKYYSESTRNTTFVDQLIEMLEKYVMSHLKKLQI